MQQAGAYMYAQPSSKDRTDLGSCESLQTSSVISLILLSPFILPLKRFSLVATAYEITDYLLTWFSLTSSARLRSCDLLLSLPCCLVTLFFPLTF
jgi:hypothetical protein